MCTILSGLKPSYCIKYDEKGRDTFSLAGFQSVNNI